MEVAAGGADAPPLRQQRVRAAVDELARAVDGDLGTAYLQKVEAWARRLRPTALSLGALSGAINEAGQRWASTTPAALQARNTFVAALKQIRVDTRIDSQRRILPTESSAVLDGGVRAAPDAAGPTALDVLARLRRALASEFVVHPTLAPLPGGYPW